MTDIPSLLAQRAAERSAASDPFEHAVRVAAEVNKQLGGNYLVAERPSQLPLLAQLYDLARKQPGEYLPGNAYQAIMGRRPSRSEVVKLGQLLGALGAPSRKTGTQTLWRLDKDFAESAH